MQIFYHLLIKINLLRFQQLVHYRNTAYWSFRTRRSSPFYYLSLQKIGHGDQIYHKINKLVYFSFRIHFIFNNKAKSRELRPIVKTDRTLQPNIEFLFLITKT